MNNYISFRLPILFGILTGIFSLTGLQPSHAQTDSLGSITRLLNQYRQKALQEKMFMHLDRPAYIASETMWFKLYVVDGTLHKPISVSKVAYIEVLDNKNQSVISAKVALADGLGQGSLTIPATLLSGNYTVRAYTNWMKNFGAEFFFEKPVTIINTQKNAGLAAGKDTATYELQFFPEGGDLVQSVKSKVAFKLTDKTGKGVAAEGSVVDARGQVITTFKTLKFGLGTFYLTPTPQQQYTAVVRLSNNQSVSRKLPIAAAQGLAMQLEEISPEQIRITVKSNQSQAENIFLVGHTRQQIAVAQTALLNQGQAVFLINKQALGDGISHFTVFNMRKQPVSERLYFKRPQEKLQITAQTDKPAYSTREKVTLQVTTQGSKTLAGTSNVSLSVFRLDSLTNAEATINSYIWLSSDLQGTVENPDYYFSSTDNTANEALDNLMLTHGWRRFRWTDVLTDKPAAFTYLPEINGPLMEGKVTHSSTGKPAPNIITFMASPSRHIRMYNSVSNANGKIQFELKDFYGTRDIVVQSNTTKDSTYTFEILNPFSTKISTRQFTPFSVSEKLQTDIKLRGFQAQVQNAYWSKFNRLYQTSATDTLAFYGKPDESYLLDDYTRFKVMEEVMREYVPGVLVRIRKDGFHFLTYDRPNKAVFQNNPLVMLDGVPVFDINKIMAFDPLKIKKLEVITSRYVHGSQSFEGLVSYTTYEGDLAGFPLDPRALVIEYEGLQRQREFYAPTYDTAEQKKSRLPDQRHLLYWNPNITLEAAKPVSKTIYTGDQPGKYIIVVQGISKNGLAGSTAFTFDVSQSW